MVYSSDRAPGQEHIPQYTPGFIVLRVLQLLIGLICLGLSAYTVAVGALLGNCLMLFTALITVIVTIWEVSAHSCAKRAYNYWAVLAFDIFLLIFWLISFAATALAAGAWLAVASLDYDDYYSSYYDYDLFDSDVATTFGAILAAAAGLGALNFLFFLISLIIHSCVVFRHRRSGLQSKPVKPGAPGSYPMAPQTKTDYAAVPQQGIPFNQQETAYYPQGAYNPQGQQPQQQPQQYQGYYAPQGQQGYYAAPQGHPQQQGGYFPQASPIAQQPTGPTYPEVAPSPQPQAHAQGYQAPSPQSQGQGYQVPSPQQTQGQTYHAPSPHHPQGAYQLPN